MKKLFLAIVTFVFCQSLSAQENSYVAPTEGYRGFAGMNIFAGVGKYPYDRFCLTSVHGFQADNIYIGMGASMQFKANDEVYYNDDGDEVDLDFTMPFFIDFNYELQQSKLSPFVDLKLGYALGSANGLYLLPSVGIRMSHINVWCGYNFTQSHITNEWSEWDSVTERYNKTSRSNTYNFNSVAFGVMIDWGGRRK